MKPLLIERRTTVVSGRRAPLSGISTAVSNISTAVSTISTAPGGSLVTDYRMPAYCDVALPVPLDRTFIYAVNGTVPVRAC